MKVPAFETLMVFEKDWRQRGFQRIAGVDEAGRGPVAGPVVAACVVFDKPTCIEGVYDSKSLSVQERERLYDKIISSCFAYSIGICEQNIIDELNILNATKIAMRKAIEDVIHKIDCVFIDGNFSLSLNVPSISIVKGDRRSFTVACASIIAKVARDRIMEQLHMEFPLYDWNKNKGYPTKRHREAIKKYGITPYHRKSFRLI